MSQPYPTERIVDAPLLAQAARALASSPLGCAVRRHVRPNSFRPHQRWRRPRKSDFISTRFISSRRRARRTKANRRSRLSFIVTRWLRSLARIILRFVPSLAEAPMDGAAPHVFYTYDTVRRFRREHPDDHLYFMLGADQFLEIATWKNYEALLDSCDFIIASRPGFRTRGVAPRDSPGKDWAARLRTTRTKSLCAKSTVHLLTTVASHVSSTEVRHRLERHQTIHGLVPARVEEYIRGQALYR